MSSEQRFSGAGAPLGISTPQDEAAEAITLVQTDPEAARERARSALTSALDQGDLAAASKAERALALAAKELGDVDTAIDHLHRAIALGQEGGHAKETAEAHMSLSLMLVLAGDAAEALREADRAAPGLHGLDAARLAMQRAAVLQSLGRIEEAEAGFGAALATFRRHEDPLWEARCLNNRGLLYVWRGNAPAALADLRRSEGLFTALGHDLAVADVVWNVGLAEALNGDIPAALQAFDRAEEFYTGHGIPRPHLLMDRCQLYLSAQLIPEGRAAATQAVARLEQTGPLLHLAEAHLMASQAALLDGDAATAAALADAAIAGFARQRRKSWLALARFAALQARALTTAGATLAGLTWARGTAAELAETGWAVWSLDARLYAAALALQLGLGEVAREELTAASRVRKVGPPQLRIQAWHAEALLRLEGGDRRGAESALLAGLRVARRHQAVLGATELRVRSSGHAEKLAALGLRMALEGGKPVKVLAWAERGRAGALLLRPVRPPEETAFAAELAELRATIAAREAAILDGQQTQRLARRQALIEEAIRKRSLRGRGREAAAGAAPTLPALREILSGRTLVELINVDGVLHAVTVGPRRTLLRELGPAAAVEAELEALRFSLRRLARGGRAAPVAAAAASARHAACTLDRSLFGPLSGALGDQPLVVIPTGPLHALPWALLPSCAGRTIDVAPSASVWYRACALPRLAPPARPGAVVLVAGPGLAAAEAEVRALAEVRPGATCLVPPQGTAERVTEALEGAALAHVAAHGRFRADNPQFSSLALSDGPLTVYDLERVRHAPRCLVLSACQSGLSAVRPGDELVGLAAALFAQGTATLVASVLDIPDDTTRQLMLDFHRALVRGVPPAAALAGVLEPASRSLVTGDPGACAAGFVCFGNGSLPLAPPSEHMPG